MSDTIHLRALLAAVPTGDPPACSCGRTAPDESCNHDCAKEDWYYRRSCAMAALRGVIESALPALLDRSDESDIAARDLCGCLSVESVDGRTLAQIVEAVIARVDELEREREKLRAEVERLRILTEKLQPTSSGATDVGNCNQRDGGGCDEFIRGTPTTKTCDGDGHYECKECFHFARTSKGGRDE